jgi:ethanolamine utilization protein EutM
LAIGFLECAGYGALLYAMDKACKAADIKILGIDTINPKDSSAFIPLTAQVKFEGKISDVKVAVEVAREAALRFNSEKEVIASIIEQPYDGVDKLAKISKVKIQKQNKFI